MEKALDTLDGNGPLDDHAVSVPKQAREKHEAIRNSFTSRVISPSHSSHCFR